MAANTKAQERLTPQTDCAQMVLMEILRIEQRCQALGLIVGARALNQARNAIGWEMAGDDLSASLAAKGERPKGHG